LFDIEDFETAKTAYLEMKKRLVGPKVVEKEEKSYVTESNEDSVFKKAQQIAKSGQEDSFYIMNLNSVKDRVQLWNENLPGVKLHYAVKTNSDPCIIKLLIDLNCNFDCASLAEIKTVLSLGANPDDIIFANPFKNEESLRFARQRGVKLMTFDCEEEA
jgi:ornithine decarboxylase